MFSKRVNSSFCERFLIIVLMFLFMSSFTACDSGTDTESKLPQNDPVAGGNIPSATHSEQIEGTGVDPLEPSFNEGEIAIDNIAIDDERHLIVTFFDGKVTDAGYIGGEEADGHTVAFFDYNGRLLKVEIVPPNGSAIPPAEPTRDGHVFAGWAGEYENINHDTAITAIYKAADAMVAEYTVSFVDYDGNVLKEERVVGGQSAHPPAMPRREGYVFSGWDGSYQNISRDMKLTALYKDGTVLIVSAESVEGQKDGSVTVNVSLENNPGIAGLLLYFDYDSKVLKLTDYKYGESFAKGGKEIDKDSDPHAVIWFSMDEINLDATLITLKFKILDSAEEGSTYPIYFWVPDGGIVNLVEDEISFVTYDGSIAVHE